MEEPCDITLIGGGPVGLFGAFYAGMRGMITRIIESLPELGGQPAALYPEKYVYDMPGFPRITGRELARQMTLQGLRFRPDVVLGRRVETVSRRHDGILELGTTDGRYLTRTAVICGGAGAFTPKRLEAPGLAEREGRGVYYFAPPVSSLQDRDVIIVGGGDSALDWARNLEPVARTVTLAHRRDVFRAHEESVHWLLNESRVDVRLFREVRRVEGVEGVERVALINRKTGAEEWVQADALLVSIGFNASLGPILGWGLELEGNQIKVNARMETRIAGVYAAGDICTHEGKLNLIATGVGEVCTAVNVARTYIDPRARLFPGHSSNLNLDAAAESPG